jgi:hypothetical protein
MKIRRGLGRIVRWDVNAGIRIARICREVNDQRLLDCGYIVNRCIFLERKRYLDVYLCFAISHVQVQRTQMTLLNIEGSLFRDST